jgi:hypothetical protein
MVNSAEFFGYQVGENGRLILPGLTEEETLEFEICPAAAMIDPACRLKCANSNCF